MIKTNGLISSATFYDKAVQQKSNTKGTKNNTISKETLKLQGKIARQEGRTQLGENFERASELVDIPDEELLIIYNMLRPNRSTREELLNKAREIREKYNAVACSNLIIDAVNVYSKRGILK